MAELVKNIKLSLLEPTKVKQEQLDKLYSEYLNCAKFVFSFWKSNKGITQNILHHSTYKECRNKFSLLGADTIISSRIMIWNRRKICEEIKRLPIQFSSKMFRYEKTERKTPFFAFSGIIKYKRIILPVAKNRLFKRFESHISNGWSFKSCSLIKRDKWLLQICIKRDFVCKDKGNIMGIDINAGNFALTIMNGRKVLRQLYLGQDILHERRKINIRKDKLRSIYDTTFSNRALRSLRNIKRFEYNFVRTRLFQISNQIIALAKQFNVSHIIIEDLKNLRTGRKLGNSKGRKVNGIINKIPYAKFRSVLNIIAIQQQINVVAINPYHTSKKCSKCGHINQIGTKRELKCKSCGFIVNRDLNASRNLVQNFLLGRETNSAKISSSQIPDRRVSVTRLLLPCDVCIV